jgi:hypothetical protein
VSIERKITGYAERLTITDGRSGGRMVVMP